MLRVVFFSYTTEQHDYIRKWSKMTDLLHLCANNVAKADTL